MTDTSSQALHALYAGQGGVAKVFSAKVADYVASRPGYPLPLLLRLAALGPRVADVGAGTGLLAAGLLDHGCDVTAVEPSAEMRAACDAWLGGRPGYRSVHGTAEATTLDDASVDLVTAAQAFHWFDVEPARRECLRILRPQGQVALVWNDRVRSDALHVAMDEVFARHGGERRDALLAHEDRSDVPRFFNGAKVTELDMPHEHRLDAAALQALAFSRSYMPARDCDAGREAAQALDEVFRRFAHDGAVAVRYRTVAVIGRPLA